MPIVVTCRCGRRFQAIDALVGKRVRCPACGEPLAIPATSAPPASAGVPLDLGDFPPFEQSAAEPSPLELPGDDPQQFGAAGYSGRRAQPEPLSRWLIAAMCAAVVVVVVVLIAIVFSQPWSDSGGQSREPPARQTVRQEPATTPAQPAAEPAAKTPHEPAQPAAAPQSPREEKKTPPVKSQPPAAGTQKQSAAASTPSVGSTAAPKSAAISIRLSAGVALPQSLPSGTAMGFSVDYEFVSGQPDASARYFWVIKSAQGRAVKQGVHLDRRGTLQGFVLEFQPEQGPFQSSLEDAQGRKLSELVPLR